MHSPSNILRILANQSALSPPQCKILAMPKRTSNTSKILLNNTHTISNKSIGLVASPSRNKVNAVYKPRLLHRKSPKANTAMGHYNIATNYGIQYGTNSIFSSETFKAGKKFDKSLNLFNDTYELWKVDEKGNKVKNITIE